MARQTQASPGPVMLLGITMEKPLTLPPCKNSDLRIFGDQQSYQGLYNGTITCAVKQTLSKNIETEIKKEEAGKEVHVDPAFETREGYTIKFPSGGAPSYINEVVVSTLHGRVAEIDVTTNGEEDQQRVFEDLKEKFGSPSQTNIDAMQNGFGAKFEGITANWYRAPQRISIEFKGIAATRENGRFSLEGQDMVEAEKAYELRNPTPHL
jgi:hypothetical protein